MQIHFSPRPFLLVFFLVALVEDDDEALACHLLVFSSLSVDDDNEH
jgi:hypothetical protein